MSLDQFTQIEFACPKCGLEKKVPVPLSLFTQKKFGHVKIQVPKGAVCQDHDFIAFLDLEERIIGYESVDISLSNLAKFETQEDGSTREGRQITIREIVEILGFRCFAGLIHAKLFNYPFIIIMPEEEHKINMDILDKILGEAMPDQYKNTRNLEVITYPGDIYPVATYFYALIKHRNRNALLINTYKNIVQKPWNTDLQLERAIINSAVSKEETNEQVKFLSFFFSKFLEDVEKTQIILDKVKKISKKDLVKKLQKIAITSTITKTYLSIIKEFIHKRIDPVVAKKIQD
jgi:hypothetical protein